LNAADLLGGVVGMGICSVFAISLYGVITVAYGLVALKMIVQCMGALKGNGNNGTNVPPYASVPE